MGMPGNTFGNIAGEISNMVAKREALVADAFKAVEDRWPSLAIAMIEDAGNRRRAGHWLCASNRSCGGRSPCDLLSDGDVDAVWDLLEGLGEDELPRTASGGRMAG